MKINSIEQLDNGIQKNPIPQLKPKLQVVNDDQIIALAREYALGKYEKDAEAIVISGWMARDKNGGLVCFPGQNKPFKQEGLPFWCAENREIVESLPKESYPDLTWESDPIEVELIIKTKKNG